MAEAMPVLKAEFWNAKVRFETSFALLCAKAVPVMVTLRVVGPVRVITAVSPAGRLVTVTLAPATKLSPFVPVKVPPPKPLWVIITGWLLSMLPSLADDSLKVPELYDNDGAANPTVGAGEFPIATAHPVNGGMVLLKGD